MSKIVEDTVKELINYEKIEIAEHMLNDGELSVDKIAKYLALPIRTVRKLADNL